MTKKDIIRTIKEKEAHAWKVYNRHNYIFAPDGLSYEEMCEFQRNEPESARLRHAWYALHELLEVIGETPDNNLPEAREGFDYAHEIWKKCRPYSKETA